jgi:hypothetical protein
MGYRIVKAVDWQLNLSVSRTCEFHRLTDGKAPPSAAVLCSGFQTVYESPGGISY